MLMICGDVGMGVECWVLGGECWVLGGECWVLMICGDVVLGV